MPLGALQLLVLLLLLVLGLAAYDRMGKKIS
jgi:hypothetical protein